jgi:hypothetical protein
MNTINKIKISVVFFELLILNGKICLMKKIITILYLPFRAVSVAAVGEPVCQANFLPCSPAFIKCQNLRPE